MYSISIAYPVYMHRGTHRIKHSTLLEEEKTEASETHTLAPAVYSMSTASPVYISIAVHTESITTTCLMQKRPGLQRLTLSHQQCIACP